MTITLVNDSNASASTMTYLRDFAESYTSAVNSGSIINEVNRKTVKITLTDIPEEDGYGRDLDINAMTSPSGKSIKIDIDEGHNRSNSELAATLLHELTHAYNPNLIYAKGLTEPLNYHNPSFYEKVQRDAIALGIDPHSSGINSEFYQRALRETGQEGMIINVGPSSSWSNEVAVPPRPSDEAIQTSRDIVAGKLIDSFTGQIVYADAIIRGVAAAEKKREQEIAEATAWQREHNRDRTGGGSSSSSSGSSSNSNNGRVHIPPGTPNHVRVAGVSYGGQDADARREGGAHGTPTYDNQADRLGFPIVIDLDGDGVEISPLGGSTARFDYDSDGFKELTAWVGKDDGLLVYDIGNDGLITQTREVVIAEWTADTTDTDLDALKAVFDRNNDGILNANDTAWAHSKIWNDTDQDGTVYSDRRVRAITPPTPNVPIAALIRANPLDRPLILPRYI